MLVFGIGSSAHGAKARYGSELSVDPLISSSITEAEWQDRSALRLTTCEAAERRGEVLGFLTIMPQTSGWVPAASRLHVAVGCVGMWNAASERYDQLLFREAFYQALYRDDFGDADVLPVSSLAPLDFAAEFHPAGAEMPSMIRSMRMFGDCVVRRDPAAVHALIMSEYGSPDQKAALATLGQPLSYCLAPGGELRFSPLMLRGVLAEALYKLSIAYQSAKK